MPCRSSVTCGTQEDEDVLPIVRVKEEEEQKERGLRGNDDVLAMPVYRGECLVLTDYNRCLVSVFDYRVAEGETVRWQAEEVDWGSYLSWEKVSQSVASPKRHHFYHAIIVASIYLIFLLPTAYMAASSGEDIF